MKNDKWLNIEISALELLESKIYSGERLESLLNGRNLSICDRLNEMGNLQIMEMSTVPNKMFLQWCRDELV